MISTLLHDFLAAFHEATGLQVSGVRENVLFDENERLDAIAAIDLPDGSEVELAVKKMRHVYPRDIRTAINQLQGYKRAREPEQQVELAVIAETLSPGARSALRNQGIHYYDASGTMFFRYRTWVVDVQRAPKQRTRKPSAIFTGAREQVVHALLEHWRVNGSQFLTGTELIQLAQTSNFTVSLTMQELEREDFVEATNSGPRQRRRLRDASGLLDAWAQAWQQRRDARTHWYAYAPPGNGLVNRLVDGLASRDGWAITGAAAANTLVPHLTHVDRIEVIVPPGEAVDWAKNFGLSPAEKGANVILIERKGAPLMFLGEHPQHPGLPFASHFTQYLDLLNNYGRNKELAQEFRRQALHLGPPQ